MSPVPCCVAVSSRSTAQRLGKYVGRATFDRGVAGLDKVGLEPWAAAFDKNCLPARWSPVASKAARRAYLREHAKFSASLAAIINSFHAEICGPKDPRLWDAPDGRVGRVSPTNQRQVRACRLHQKPPRLQRHRHPKGAVLAVVDHRQKP